jgi:hypothetical protein
MTTEDPIVAIDRELQHQKLLSSIAARLALAGHVFKVYLNNQGQAAYTAERWGHIRHFSDLDQVDAFLRQVRGAR